MVHDDTQYLRPHGSPADLLQIAASPLQSRNRPVVVLGAVAAQHGWTPGGTWTEEALTTLVGHASINARTHPVDGNTFGALLWHTIASTNVPAESSCVHAALIWLVFALMSYLHHVFVPLIACTSQTSTLRTCISIPYQGHPSHATAASASAVRTTNFWHIRINNGDRYGDSVLS